FFEISAAPDKVLQVLGTGCGEVETQIRSVKRREAKSGPARKKPRQLPMTSESTKPPPQEKKQGFQPPTSTIPSSKKRLNSTEAALFERFKRSQPVEKSRRNRKEARELEIAKSWLL